MRPKQCMQMEHGANDVRPNDCVMQHEFLHVWMFVFMTMLSLNQYSLETLFVFWNGEWCSNAYMAWRAISCTIGIAAGDGLYFKNLIPWMWTVFYHLLFLSLAVFYHLLSISYSTVKGPVSMQSGPTHYRGFHAATRTDGWLFRNPYVHITVPWHLYI